MAIKVLLQHLCWVVTLQTWGLFNWFFFLLLSIRSGSFKKTQEKDQLQLLLARDRFWNLSKPPIPGFTHSFFTLRNGLKLHYITSLDASLPLQGPTSLIVFLHGFPDSSLIWRHLLQPGGFKPAQDTVVVCVDLPGYGGSDSFATYGAEEVLEALTEFIVAMREIYVEPQESDSSHTMGNTLVVGHDWGAVLAYRLAAEAPVLADRFILTNGPHVELALANLHRIIDASSKMFRQVFRAPIANIRCVKRGFQTLMPLAFQILLFGYIAAFQLPPFMIKYLGTGGNFSFLRGAYRAAHGKDKSSFNAPESLACGLGPGVAECKSFTKRQKPETYPESVLHRAKNPGYAFLHQTAYYRDGPSIQPWEKSLQTIADLHDIAMASSPSQNSPFRRRSSAGTNGLFVDNYKGSLKAPATVVWGKKDLACTKAICLDGIGDYLSKGSEVVLLPHTGHWTIVEKPGRAVLGRVLEFYLAEQTGHGGREKGKAKGADIGVAIGDVSADATVIIRK